MRTGRAVLLAWIAIGGLIIMSSSAGAAFTAPSPVPVAPTAGGAAQIAVVSTQVWTDTGLAVQPGDTLVLHASGTVHFGTPPIAQMGPDGVPWGVRCEQVANSSGNWPAPGLPCWSLIGRIGTGTPFAVGSSSTIHVVRPGELFLGANDNQLADNAGSWSVGITRSHPTPTTTSPTTVPTTVPPTTAPPTKTSSSPVPLIAIVAGILAALALGLFFFRRRGTSSQPNIIDAKLLDSGRLTISYRSFPEDSLIRWKVQHNDVTAARGELFAEGGQRKHTRTVMLPAALPARVDDYDIVLLWSIDGTPGTWTGKRAPSNKQQGQNW